MRVLETCLCWLALVVTVAEANSQSEASIDYEISTDGSSEALEVVIHGGGNLDLTGLEVGDEDEDAESLLHAAIITVERWQSIEDASSNGLLGATGTDNKFYLCCSEAASEVGACDFDNDQYNDQAGEPIVRSNNIKIQSVPAATGSESEFSRWQKPGVIRYRQTSHVAVVFINCEEDDDGGSTTLRIQGKVTWTSSVTASMLPFFAIITLIHLGMVSWYRIQMAKHKTSRINVENWIFITIVFATICSVFETTSQTSEVFGMNEIMFFKITSMLLSLARYSITRCLYLVLSMGLGVAVESLSKITTFLIATFLVIDVFLLWAMHMAFYMNIHITVNTFVVIWIRHIFNYWIPIALLYTMYRLWKKKEQAKLFRYKVFLGIYALRVFFAYMERLYFGKKGFGQASFREANDIINLFPLVCIAILWRPNPEQKKYSHGYVLLEEEDDNKEEENTVQGFGDDDESAIELIENDEVDGYNDNDKTDDANNVV